MSNFLNDSFWLFQNSIYWLSVVFFIFVILLFIIYIVGNIIELSYKKYLKSKEKNNLEPISKDVIDFINEHKKKHFVSEQYKKTKIFDK